MPAKAMMKFTVRKGCRFVCGTLPPALETAVGARVLVNAFDV